MKLIRNNYLSKKIIFFSLPLFILLSISLTDFTTKKSNADSLKLCLKWHKGYESQKWHHVKIGMLWSFSYLGAELPKGSFDESVLFKDSTLFVIDIGKLGFNEQAEKALAAICDSIKQTMDYKTNQYIDLSRFLVLTLHSSYHYYNITGVAKNYSDFSKRYKLNDSYQFGVTKSAVSKGDRIIKFSRDTSLFNVGFAAEEGTGRIVDSTFKVVAFEVFDIMQNGQFRYAIYNEKGELIDASSKKHSDAGKPSKCMWCHETNIQPLFSQNIAINNMMSNEEFMKRVADMQVKLDFYRQQLNTDINFKMKQDHTSSELLYITFMEPSLFRLKDEFKNDTIALLKIKKMITHIYPEFPFLGNLYHREIVDKSFNYPKIKIPQSVREQSKYEPRFIK